MDAATIRATCPNCQATLKIPSAWAGQVVKCKKCGSGVRTKAADLPPSPEPMSLDRADTNGHADYAAHSPGGFEDLGPARPSRATQDNPFEGSEHATPEPGYHPNGYFPGAPPGYPYPMPPGYAGPPPGYPYPMPPGYAGPPPGYPYPMPPGYPQPVAYDLPPAGFEPQPYQPPAYQPPPPQFTQPVQTGPSAAAVAVAESGFKPSEATSSQRGRARGGYRRGPDRGKFIWIGVALLLTAGLVVGGIYGAKILTKKSGGGEQAGSGDPPKEQPKGSGGTPGTGGTKPPLLASSGSLPRRLLFIHISNYLYLNPLTSSSMDGKIHGPEITKSAAIGLGYEWRIPRDKDNDQLFLLSDTASDPDRRLPMRDVITGTYEKFFDTSRAQDRIAVYFGGHVFTKDGKTYLVPIEGDPDEPEKLIPLESFYAKIGACKATQKVVIWDVCRYNPERGRQRPGSEPMSEETAKALSAPPPGVQAVLTCQAGENAFEFYNVQTDAAISKTPPPSVVGSNFLSAGRYVSNKNRNNAKQQNPDDAIPVEEWSKALGGRAAEVVAAEGKGKQTVKVFGAAPATLAATSKEEAAAARFEYPPSPKSASPMEVGAIASEMNLPGIKKDDGDSGVANFPFPAESLAPYKADVSITDIMADKEKYAFRIAVLDAYAKIKDAWNGPDNKSIREEFVGGSSDAVKKEVLAEQRFPARAISKLEQAITLLENVGGMRETEPKRWQAHYDYVLAQCKARLAWMHEYDLALGSIRTEVLPPLDKMKGHDGYKLVSQEKMKVKKEAKYADEAKELYEKIIADYKGSPWAIQAKRDKAFSLGLSWQPFNSKAGMPEPPP